MRKQFSVKVGTIFEDSPIRSDKWLIALWMLVNCKNGISSYEVGARLGITQKSAWFVLHRLRLALAEQVRWSSSAAREKRSKWMKLSSVARLAIMHPGRRKRRMITGDRRKGQDYRIRNLGARRRRFALPSCRIAARSCCRARFAKHVEAGTAALYRCASCPIMGLNQRYSQHKSLTMPTDTSTASVHTNGLENFWSLLKRGSEGNLCQRRAVPLVPLSGRTGISLQ